MLLFVVLGNGNVGGVGGMGIEGKGECRGFVSGSVWRGGNVEGFMGGLEVEGGRGSGYVILWGGGEGELLSGRGWVKGESGRVK